MNRSTVGLVLSLGAFGALGAALANPRLVYAQGRGDGFVPVKGETMTLSIFEE